MKESDFSSAEKRHLHPPTDRVVDPAVVRLVEVGVTIRDKNSGLADHKEIWKPLNSFQKNAFALGTPSTPPLSAAGARWVK